MHILTGKRTISSTIYDSFLTGRVIAEKTHESKPAESNVVPNTLLLLEGSAVFLFLPLFLGPSDKAPNVEASG